MAADLLHRAVFRQDLSEDARNTFVSGHGREQSSLRNQRRSVEGSATWLASNTVAAEDSQEQCSAK
jgi:hypothetical protein